MGLRPGRAALRRTRRPPAGEGTPVRPALNGASISLPVERRARKRSRSVRGRPA